MKTALVIGATGLVGSKLVKILLKSKKYSKVVIFVRKETDLQDKKLKQYLINFDELESYQHLIEGDDLFCCLGTTIKKAKSKENFTKVDLNYPLSFAKIARDKGVKKILLISSIGANFRSGNYYLRTKGLLEEKIKQLEFPGVFIFRPSVLSGKRKEIRIGEKAGEWLLSLFSVFLIGKLKKYRVIKAEKVAKAMYLAAQTHSLETYIYESDKIQEIADSFPDEI